MAFDHSIHLICYSDTGCSNFRIRIAPDVKYAESGWLGCAAYQLMQLLWKLRDMPSAQMRVGSISVRADLQIANDSIVTLIQCMWCVGVVTLGAAGQSIGCWSRWLHQTGHVSIVWMCSCESCHGQCACPAQRCWPALLSHASRVLHIHPLLAL